MVDAAYRKVPNSDPLGTGDKSIYPDPNPSKPPGIYIYMLSPYLPVPYWYRRTIPVLYQNSVYFGTAPKLALEGTDP